MTLQPRTQKLSANCRTVFSYLRLTGERTEGSRFVGTVMVLLLTTMVAMLIFTACSGDPGWTYVEVQSMDFMSNVVDTTCYKTWVAVKYGYNLEPRNYKRLFLPGLYRLTSGGARVLTGDSAILDANTTHRIDAMLVVAYRDHIPPGNYVLRVDLYKWEEGKSQGYTKVASFDTKIVTVPAFSEEECGCEDLELHVYNDNEHEGKGTVPEGSCTFLDPNRGQMPDIHANVIGDLGDTVDWRCEITYNRSGRADTFVVEDLGVPASFDWDPQFWDTIYGGEALISCTPLNGDCIKFHRFSIRSHNPTSQAVEDAIEADPRNRWYTKYIAKHESDSVTQGKYYAQFNEVGDPTCDASGVRHTPNASGDGGFGIFQLTNFGTGAGRAPNTQELWNWKANVKTAIAWLDTLRDSCSPDLSDQYNSAIAYCGADITCIIPSPQYEGDSNNVAIAHDSEHDFYDACTMKRYNGLGTRVDSLDIRPYDYLTWNANLDIWRVTRSVWYRNPNDSLVEQFYVNRVCSLFP